MSFDWGGLLGGVLDLGGTIATNQANRDISDRTWKRQKWLATNRYQITMQDMMAAGLNPILAYQQGGGPVANVQQQAPAQNVMSGLASAATEFLPRKDAIKVRANTIDQGKANIEATEAGTETTRTQADLNNMMNLKAQEERINAMWRAKETEQRARYLSYQGDMLEKQLPRAAFEEKIYKDLFRDADLLYTKARDYFTDTFGSNSGKKTWSDWGLPGFEHGFGGKGTAYDTMKNWIFRKEGEE